MTVLMPFLVRIMAGLVAGSLFWLATTAHFVWLAAIPGVVWAGHVVAEAWETQ